MDTLHLIPTDYTFPTNPPLIPALLHLIWVGSNPRPDYVDRYVEQWNALMPTWSVRLWTNEDLTESEFPADILTKIHACTKGAQKADIMRYFIMYKYGGIYLDTDIVPHRSLEPIRDIGTPVVLCHDLPVTWPYISIGFFASVPHHPLFNYTCQLCRGAVINIGDLCMTTGPRVLGEAVWRVKPTEPYTLLHCYYFYRNRVGDKQLDLSLRTEDYDHRFGTHFYAKGW